MESSAEQSGNQRRRGLLVAAAALLIVAVVALVVWQLSGGTDTADAQTVLFEEPTEAGKDPFTKPADVRGPERVEFEPSTPSDSESSIGAGPFGGSGSDLVCDRELLIKSLVAQPDRMRAWAGVLGITPSESAVSRYIRSLTPTTLTVDTRVTNHTFVNGRAVPSQSILAAGTAVLVDKYGRPVARCRCGNPLLEPIFIKTTTCTNCPPDYRPPPPCIYKPYRPWGDYPLDRLPPAWRDPYPKDYPKPKYGGKDGELCYVLYPKPPKPYYPPPYEDPEALPEPDDTDPGPTYDEPVDPEPVPVPPPPEPQDEPPPPPEHESPPQEEPGGDTYCYEADSPDRFEPGCQGTFGPPPG